MSERVDGYAAAIFEVAKAEDLLGRVSDEFYLFAKAVESSDELRQTLTDATLPAETRMGVVEDLLGLRASVLTAHLVSFIVGVGRARLLSEIAEQLVALVASEREHEVAEIRTAVPLDSDQQARLAKALSDALGKQVELRVVIDPQVLGGVLARVGDTVIDGTVRHRLDQLREAL